MESGSFFNFCDKKAGRLTKLRVGFIITVKSKPRTRLAPKLLDSFQKAEKTAVHLWGVAAVFLSFFAFAFLEVSRTMIVTVHFL